MNLFLRNKLIKLEKISNGFAIPQVLILGVGVAVAVTGLMAVSILGLTGSRIKRQELIAKASSYSGITTIRSLLNDSSQGSLFHYFWLVNGCSKTESGCSDTDEMITDPSQKYWSDDEWCEGSTDCDGRQKAPVCNYSEKINWNDNDNGKSGIFAKLFDSKVNKVGTTLEDSSRDFEQTFNFISTKYIGTENYGVNSMLLEGKATSIKANQQTALNKLRVNIQIISETPEEGFGFLSVGENQSDGNKSFFLGNLNITPTGEAKGSIIWRRNLDDNIDCDNFEEEHNGYSSSLPEIGNGGIWIQPIGLPKQPRLSNVKDIGILICTPEVFDRDGTDCKLDSEDLEEKVYRIHSLYVKGPGSKFEISTTDSSRIILEIMGDIDISNGGIFCHKDGINICGSGKPENLTILFKQKTNSEGNKMVCNDDRFSGGVKLKENVNFSDHKYPIDNNKLPGGSFLIDNTGDEFGAFIYGPKTTFLSALTQSEWVQVPHSEERNNNAGMIVTSRATYGWIKNTLGRSFEDNMVNLVLTPEGDLIPYLGQKENDNFNIEIIGVGNRVEPCPECLGLDPSSDKVFLIYDKSNKTYYLRTFDVTDANPSGERSSEYSYPLAFAKMNKKIEGVTNLKLTSLDSPKAKEWLDRFNINMQKSTDIPIRNFSGAAWVKNLCFDAEEDKNWRFSKDFINKLKDRHGEEFNWGVRYYKGRSILLWDTLRDFKS